MNSAWHNAPLLRLLLPFMLGIISYIWHPDLASLSVFALIIFFIICFIIISFKVLPRHQYTNILSYTFFPLLLVCGYWITASKTEKNHQSHFSKAYTEKQPIKFWLIETPTDKGKTIKITAEIIGLKKDNEWQSASGKVLISLIKDSASQKLNYGDILITNQLIQPISPPHAPQEVDYKTYYSHQQISHQAFLPHNTWIKTGESNGNAWIKKTLACKKFLLQKIKNTGVKDNEYAVAVALLVGEKRALNADILSAYATTGVIHILNVSGMHVGIIYLFLNWILSFLKNITYGYSIKALLLLVALCAYCILTGLSPSVLRATVMLSFFIIAEAYGKRTNIFNILAASAFLLLLTNPYLLMNIGFQLSYMAVLGIILFQDYLYSLKKFNNYFADKAWFIVTLSVAAQLTTFPLCLYYFHMFPSYFLIANLLALPLAIIIVYSGIGALLLSEISGVSVLINGVFKYSLLILNASLNWIEQLPHTRINNVFLSKPQLLLSYIFIAFAFHYFIYKKTKYLYPLLSLIILWIGIDIYEAHKQRSPQIIIYNTPKSTAIDYIYNTSGFFIQKTTNKKDLSPEHKNSIQTFRKRRGVITSENISDSTMRIAPLFKEKNFMVFVDKRIMLINEHTSIFSDSPNADYLIISNGFTGELSVIHRLHMPEIIIFDASVNRNKLHLWKQECDANNYPYYAVSDSGAWIKYL